MAAVTIRNIPESTHRALKQRAHAHGKSTEAEIRAILEQAVRPQERLQVGSALAAIGRKLNLPDTFQLHRDRRPAEPADFE